MIFAGAHRSVQLLRGLYPLLRRDYGEAFCKPVNGGSKSGPSSRQNLRLSGRSNFRADAGSNQGRESHNRIPVAGAELSTMEKLLALSVMRQQLLAERHGCYVRNEDSA